MGTKYSSNAESGYNATPPADDGTVSEANKVKWSTIKTKLSDPVKSLAETINSELVTHFDHGPTALTTNTTLGASHYEQFIQVSGSGVTLTLSDAATLGAGWNCEIHSTDSSNDVAIARATASDTINSLSNNFVLLPLQSVKVFVNAAANGFILRDFGNKQSTDAGAGIGPVQTVYRNSASPAASDVIGGYNFDGEDSAGNRETYAGLYAEIVDPGTTTEDGRLHFRTVIAGTLASRGYFQNGFVLGSATGGDQGSGTINATAFYENGSRLGYSVVASANGASGATVDIPLNFGYKNYVVEIWDVLTATDDVQLYARLSTNAGSSFSAGASDYNWYGLFGGTAASDGDDSEISLTLDGSSGNVMRNFATDAGNFTLRIPNVLSTDRHPRIYWTGMAADTSDTPIPYFGAGCLTTAQDTDYLRILASSGNISSLSYTVFAYN